MVFLLTLFFSFIIFLFSLYVFAKDDFILLRKNVSLEQVFNYAFSSAGVGLLGGRIFYVFFHPAVKYLNPLIFFVFIYFPGLSLIGGIVGVAIFLFLLARKKKLPKERLYDIFALSFLPAVVAHRLISEIVQIIVIKKFFFLPLIATGIFLGVFLIFFLLFQKNKTRDGTVGISIIALFFCISYGEHLLVSTPTKSVFLHQETITLGILCLISILLLIKQKTLRRKR